MNNINKVKVTICGKEYNLCTDDTPEYIMGLAARIDKEVNDLLKTKPNFGVQNAAVFVALTALDESNKAKNAIEGIREQINTYLTEAAKAKEAKASLNARIKELESRIAELEKENAGLKKAAKTSSDECEQLVLADTITPAVMIYAGDDKAAGESEDNKAASEPKAENASSDKPSQPSPEQETEENEQTKLTDPDSKDVPAADKQSAPNGHGTETENDENSPSADNMKQPKKKGRGRSKKN